jgi:hypothetical protein
VLTKKYGGTANSSVNISTGRYGGGALHLTNNATYVETPDVKTAGLTDYTTIVGFAFKSKELTNNLKLVDLRHSVVGGGSTGTLSFRVDGGGNNSDIKCMKGPSTTLNTSANGTTPSLQKDTWYYFEAKVYVHATSGTVNAYVDGTEIFNYTGNTMYIRYVNQALSYGKVLFQMHATGDELHIDDFYIADTTGSGVTGVLGANTRVETFSPTSDVSGTDDWSPNTGSDLYAVIDEDTRNANYISDDTTANQALFETTNLSNDAYTSGTVEGVQLSCESRQTSRFKKYAKAITQNGSGGSIQDTGNFAPGIDTNPSCHTQVMTTDPDGNTWSVNAANDLRIGVEVS